MVRITIASTASPDAPCNPAQAVIVCLCHRVSDRDIAREAGSCRSFDELQERLRVGTACGACVDCAQDCFRHADGAPAAGLAPRRTIALVPAFA
jgi:bacterioferritin-associated ferredoxin